MCHSIDEINACSLEQGYASHGRGVPCSSLFLSPNSPLMTMKLYTRRCQCSVRILAKIVVPNEPFLICYLVPLAFVSFTSNMARNSFSFQHNNSNVSMKYHQHHCLCLEQV